jgi:hypothetical protein
MLLASLSDNSLLTTQTTSRGTGGISLDFSLCKKIVENISRVIVGKRDSIELLLVALLADGHVLIEDMPGPAKTNCQVPGCIGVSFRRVQLHQTSYLGYHRFNIMNWQTDSASSNLGLS